jgi:hypothetical protein
MTRWRVGGWRARLVAASVTAAFGFMTVVGLLPSVPEVAHASEGTDGTAYEFQRPPAALFVNRAGLGYYVVFRTNAPLPRSGSGSILGDVTLNGTASISGPWTVSKVRNCYAQTIDPSWDYPKSLRKPRPGQSVTVRLFVRGFEGAVDTMRVRLRRDPLRYGTGEAGRKEYRRMLRRMRCRRR